MRYIKNKIVADADAVEGKQQKQTYTWINDEGLGWGAVAPTALIQLLESICNWRLESDPTARKAQRFSQRVVCVCVWVDS